MFVVHIVVLVILQLFVTLMLFLFGVDSNVIYYGARFGVIAVYFLIIAAIKEMFYSDTSKRRKGDKKHEPKRPRVKLKLSKEQKAYVHDLVKLENRVIICREYIDLWMRYFRFIAEIHEDKEVTAADEKAFFQIMTTLARKHFLFVELMGDTFDGEKDVTKILTTSVSLSAVKMMNENTRDKLELDWHTQFLAMNKALGRLLRMMPGERTLTETLASLRAAKPVAPAAAPAAAPAK